VSEEKKHGGPADGSDRDDGRCACVCGCPEMRDPHSNVCIGCARAVMAQNLEERQTPRPPTDLTDRLIEWATWWRTCLDCGNNHVSVEPAEPKWKLAECPDCHAFRSARTAPAVS
jgi:hypothetical protein